MFPRTRALPVALAGTLALAAIAHAGNSLQIGNAYVDPAEINIGYRVMITGDDNLNAACQVRFRKVGQSDWSQGLNGWRFHTQVTPSEDGTGGTNNVIDRAENRFAGSVFWVEPGDAYEIELTLSDPDGVTGTNPVLLTTTTWTELVPNPAGRKLYVIPGSGGGTGTITDPFKGLPAAHAAAQPGDIFYIAPGTYPAFTITKNGSPGNPICWIGPADQSAILDGAGGSRSLQLGDTSNPIHHIIIERLTLQNSSNGLYASRVQHTKVRHCRIFTTGSGYTNSNSGTEYRQAVLDCIVTGDEPWIVSNIGSSQGIEIKGSSAVVAHNYVSDMADGISIDPYTSTSVSPYGANNNCYDVYGNFVTRCGDDAIELDHIVANCRAWRNAATSSRMGFSNQPLFGGPCYIFRNEIFCLQDSTNGTAAGSAFKLHNGASGTVLIHNTSSKNGPGMATCMFQNSFFRNNVLMGATDALVMYTCGTYNAQPPALSVNDWDYNAYRAGSGRTLVDWFNQQNYTSLTLLASQRGVEAHGNLAAYAHFVQAVPPSSFTAPSKTLNDFDFSLVAGAPEINAGAVLPNINDPFVTDGQPDIGALEYGEPRPKYGPRPIGDANVDYLVNDDDLIAVRNTLGAPVSRNPRSDLFIDGAIDLKDMLFARNRALGVAGGTSQSTAGAAVHFDLVAPDGSKTVYALTGRPFEARVVADIQGQPMAAMAWRLSASASLPLTGRTYAQPMRYVPSAAGRNDLPVTLGTWLEAGPDGSPSNGDGVPPGAAVLLATYTFHAPATSGQVALNLSDADAAYTSLRYPDGQTFEQVSAGTPLTVMVRRPGDITGDDRVNVFDLQRLAASWNRQQGQAGYDPACDFTGDGKVNVFDLQVMAANWNT